MKKKIAVKLLMAIPALLVISLVIVAQAQNGDGDGDKKLTVPGKLPVKGQADVSVASATVTAVRLTAKDGVVKLQAEALVKETEPGYLSVWSVRIYQDKQLVKEHHYAEAPWAVEEGKTTMKPWLTDEFPLQPGNYEVKVAIYRVPADWDWDKVAPGEDFRRRTRGRAQFKKKITVGL